MTAFCVSLSSLASFSASKSTFVRTSSCKQRPVLFSKQTNVTHKSVSLNRRLHLVNVLSATKASKIPSVEAPPIGYHIHDWNFKSFRVQYATAGVEATSACLHKPAIVLVHGFGANCQHWRRNMQPLADQGFRVFALDLLGFGMGEKPKPGTNDSDGNPVEYTFDYWTSELSTFIETVVETRQGARRPVFLVANSIGCMVTMQYAVENPTRVSALTFISPSLRQLNVRKRSWVQDITAPALMTLLANRPIGAFFLKSMSKPDVLRSVLQGAYAKHEAVDNDLVQILRQPAQTRGALDVFLSFISYDTGPIPEDFLPRLSQPALVIWGEEDQFEPFELGQKLSHYSIVEKFVPISGVGHCAHDEIPDQVNKLMTDFFNKHFQTAGMPS